MAVYVVQGKLGTGKTKYCVGKMREALLQGRAVATNLDLRMEHLMPAQSRATAIRLPDKPTADDLLAIGHGNPDSYDEERNGVLVLDELGSWLNARQFADKGRAAVIDWLIHARKYGWDVYLIVQNISMIDKQIRDALAEYVVRTIRADKMKLPGVGALLGKYGRMPRFHIARISIVDVPGVVVDRDYFRGDGLHSAYDTRQIFKSDPEARCFSYLSAWHLVGRYLPPKPKRGFWHKLLGIQSQPVVRPPLKQKGWLASSLMRLDPDDRVTVFRRMQQRGLA